MASWRTTQERTLVSGPSCLGLGALSDHLAGLFTSLIMQCNHNRIIQRSLEKYDISRLATAALEIPYTASY